METSSSLQLNNKSLHESRVPHGSLMRAAESRVPHGSLMTASSH